MDVQGLGVGKQRYALFTNDAGGILDDLMITRRENDLLLVVNAACKDADTAHLQRHIGERCRVVPLPERALLALQGPKAVDALARLAPGVRALTFMTGGAIMLSVLKALEDHDWKDVSANSAARIDAAARTFRAVYPRVAGVAGVVGMATAAGATAVVGKPSSPPSTSSPLPRGGDGGGEEALIDSTM